MILAHCKLQGESGHDAGRRLLRQLFWEQTGREMPEIALTERGKPYFLHEEWQFSISHTKSHAFCALSRNPVGIDAEELDRNVKLALADKVLSSAEKAQFEAASDQRRALLTFWVLKEATAKFTGEGLRGYPNHTNFTLEDPRVTEIDCCLVAVVE